MGNSTIKLQKIVDDAFRMGDLAPALASGGSSTEPALSIANDVITDMINGTPDGNPFNWKWNRLLVAPFVTISQQQDYAGTGSTIGYLEDCYAVDINSTSTGRKPKIPIDVKRDLPVGYLAPGRVNKICWLPNDQLQYGVWGQSQADSVSGLRNPDDSVVYTNPIGATQTPDNPTTQIILNGLYLVLTGYGTCGSTAPDTTNKVIGDTIADGSCTWTVVDPKAQGFRLGPTPPRTGKVWQIHPIAQAKPVPFTSLSQLLDPLPDEYVRFFKQGFFAQCYLRSPDAKVRGKFAQAHALWLKSLDNAIKSGDRETEDMGIVPSRNIMDAPYGYEPNSGYPWSS